MKKNTNPKTNKPFSDKDIGDMGSK
jgi:hypothetical protein